MSAEFWKIEKDLCRCCHSEGTHKNLAEPCLEGGEEIYSEMLHETLDINISPVSGDLGTVTYTICEVCIMRLQDAWSFKQQVLQCENRFNDLYTRNIIKLEPDCVVVAVKEETGSDNEGFKEERIDDSDGDFEMTYGDGNNSDSDMDTQDTKAKPKAKPKAKSKATPKAPPKKKSATKTSTTKEAAEGQAVAKEKKGEHEELINMPYIAGERDGEKQFICSCCQKPFNKLQNFAQHYRNVHLKMRPKLRSCHMCPVKVPGHMRTRHMEEAHGVPRPQCLACGKKFAFPFQVIQHQKSFHMNEKPYACSKCDLRFSVPSKLAKHEVKHSSIRSYECRYCDKTFKWKKNLEIHVMMHLDVRKHVCIACPAAFVQSSSLKYHMMKRHPDLV